MTYDEGIVLDIFGIGDLCMDPELPDCTSQTETPGGENKVTSTAIYGDFTYHLTDRVGLTAGARYTKDKKKMWYDNPPTDGIFGVFGEGVTGIFTDGRVYAEDSWSSFDPRIAIDFAVTENTTLFGNIAKGYKSGGINRTVLQVVPDPQFLDPFDEEKVTAYEVGTKSSLLDGRASLNFSAFYNDYKDYQLETFLRGVPRVLNIGDIKSQGIELEGRVLVTDNFELAGTYAYLDSKVKNSLDPALVGNRTPQSPKHSASAQAHYYIPISAGEFKLSGILAYSDNFWFDIENTLDQPSYTKIDLRVGYTPKSGRWGIAAFADNVTDEEYFAERFVFLDVANRRAPGRLWRVEATVHF
jgi:iron complex outermembrane receptor protein